MPSQTCLPRSHWLRRRVLRFPQCWHYKAYKWYSHKIVDIILHFHHTQHVIVKPGLMLATDHQIMQMIPFSSCYRDTSSTQVPSLWRRNCSSSMALSSLVPRLPACFYLACGRKIEGKPGRSSHVPDVLWRYLDSIWPQRSNKPTHGRLIDDMAVYMALDLGL